MPHTDDDIARVGILWILIVQTDQVRHCNDRATKWTAFSLSCIKTCVTAWSTVCCVTPSFCMSLDDMFNMGGCDIWAWRHHEEWRHHQEASNQPHLHHQSSSSSWAYGYFFFLRIWDCPPPPLFCSWHPGHIYGLSTCRGDLCYPIPLTVNYKSVFPDNISILGLSALWYGRGFRFVDNCSFVVLNLFQFISQHYEWYPCSILGLINIKVGVEDRVWLKC